jgi:microcompartment protein CcmL/EutN
MAGPTLGVLEIDGLARGIVAADAALKKAAAQVLWAGPVTPGKYLLLLRGEVAETEEALAAGAAVAGDRLLEQLLLPQAHAEVWLALGPPRRLPLRAVGIVETLGAVGALRGLDAACKAADVAAASLQLSRGIGGKGLFTLSGEQHALEAALDAAANILGSGLVERQLIPRPHPGLSANVLPTLE